MQPHSLLSTIIPLTLGFMLTACVGDNQTFISDYGKYEASEGQPLACLPNLDGVLESYEMAPSIGTIASYLVSPALPATATQGVSVNTEGVVNHQGRRIWDWSFYDTTHQVAQIMAQPLLTQWYANAFPGGQFATPSDMGGKMMSIYSHDDNALRLHGVASTEENPPEGKTLLVYETPVDLFPFPLTLGKEWTQKGVVTNGTVQGLTPWSQEDVYEIKVDSAGEMRLPDFTFTQVLRISTKVTLKPKTGSPQGYSQRQTSFVFECFGEVAKATSMLFLDDPATDPGPNFIEASEIRRLGWF